MGHQIYRVAASLCVLFSLVGAAYAETNTEGSESKTARPTFYESGCCGSHLLTKTQWAAIPDDKKPVLLEGRQGRRTKAAEKPAEASIDQRISDAVKPVANAFAGLIFKSYSFGSSSIKIEVENKNIADTEAGPQLAPADARGALKIRSQP